MVVFLTVGQPWLKELSSVPKALGLFLWLFAAILTLAFGVVRHADCLAVLPWAASIGGSQCPNR